MLGPGGSGNEGLRGQILDIVGVRGLGSGDPGTGICEVSEARSSILEVSEASWKGLESLRDQLEGIGEPWRPLEGPGDAQKPGL